VAPAAAQPLVPWGTTRDDARLALAALAHADADGLDPARYRVTADAHGAGLTAAMMHYMQDVRAGRPELEGLDADVALPRTAYDAAAALDTAVRQGSLGALLAGLAPPQEQYAKLKAALARYRAIAADGGWPILPPAAPADFVGHYGSVLRQRLAFEDAAAALPDADLPEAVKRFQARNGLDPDGVVGAKTLAALNISAAARADTIAANLERWRWLPRALEADHIAINVPDAKLELRLAGQVVLASRVVVGRPHDPTPILRAEGAGITVNPPWNVPASIAVREILPKLKVNHAYLVSQDMVLVNGPPDDPQGLHIDWRAIPAGRFPYQVRQIPGPRNALGRVKIELPNRFDVYLHDTPDRSAFARPSRDLSHGCVRVEQILPLASYALSGDTVSVERITVAIDTGETQHLPLKKLLPVYFLYWTAFTSRDGTVQFRPDIYGRDRRLIAAMRPEAMAMAAAAWQANCSKG